MASRNGRDPGDPTAAALRAIYRQADERRDVEAPLIALARQTHWLVFHAYSSRRSQPGFPDLVLIRVAGQQSVARYGPPYVIFAECKRQAGRLTPAQLLWGRALACVEVLTEGAVLYRVVRPSTRHLLEAILVGLPRGAPQVPPRLAREVVG